MEENRRGFHNTASQGHDHNTGGQSRMAPPVGKRNGMSEPTNHTGHTHEMARRHEADRRIEAMRAKRGSEHAEPSHVTQSKHGADHHVRGGDLREEPGERREEPE